MTRSLRSLLTLASVVAAFAVAPAGASALSIDPVGNGGYTNAADVTISYSDPGSLTIATCTLDSAPVSCTSSSAVLAGIAEGSHSFSVSGMTTTMMCTMWDPVSPGICMVYTPFPMPVGPAVIDFVVDRTAPVVSIASWPTEGSTVIGTDESIGVSTNEGTLTCKIDGVAVTCTDAVALAGLGVGAHQLTVTATDQAGNTSAPLVRNFTVKAPVPAITRAPKKVKVGKTFKASVDCPAGCKISVLVKMGAGKLTLKPLTVKPGATSVSVKFSGGQKRLIKRALSKGTKVKIVLTPSGGGASKTVKVKK